MYKTLLIDLDDTLWDTRTNGKESMEEVFRDYGFDRFFPDFDTFYAIYYPNNCELWRQYRCGEITKDELIVERLLFPLRPFGNFSTKYILDLNTDFLDRTTRKKKLLPHAIEALDHLRGRYRMFILSNGFEEVQQRKLDNSGLSVYFDDMILSDQVGVNKPHPRIFEAALTRADARKEETLMIGDSWEADIQGAHRAGIDQLWFDQGLEQSSGFEPTYRISSLRELTTIL